MKNDTQKIDSKKIAVKIKEIVIPDVNVFWGEQSFPDKGSRSLLRIPLFFAASAPWKKKFVEEEKNWHKFLRPLIIYF